MGLKKHREYENLIKDNFKFDSREMFNRTSMFRNWRFVDNALHECKKLYSEANNIKKLTVKTFLYTALSDYSDNPTPFEDLKEENPKKAKISIKMLEIFCRLSKKPKK